MNDVLVILGMLFGVMGGMWFYYECYVLPRFERWVVKETLRTLDERVIATAQKLDQTPVSEIRGVCVGGALDGFEFTQDSEAPVASWVRGGKRVGTYAQSYRQNEAGQWEFRHVKTNPAPIL